MNATIKRRCVGEGDEFRVWPASTRSPPTIMTSSSRLPPLREITPAEVDKLPELPSKKIKTDHDIDLWKTTRSYYDFSLFVRRLCESVVGRELPYEPEVVGEVRRNWNGSV